jgi:predicted O-methyltransferase YrrM
VRQELWTEVDRLLDGLVVGSDPALEAALAGNAAGGLPAIDLSPTQGKLLHLLGRLAGARRILELGALGGYSTIWLARALPPDGRLISLELDPGYAEVARANVARAGLSDLVEIRVGPALETLPALAAEDGGPFDLVFIDADKEGTPAYFDWALALTKPGSLIVVDNAVRGGAILEPDHADSRVRAMRSFVEQLAAEPRVSATVIQTVGSKGYDGFAVALVR